MAAVGKGPKGRWCIQFRFHHFRFTNESVWLLFHRFVYFVCFLPVSLRCDESPRSPEGCFVSFSRCHNATEKPNPKPASVHAAFQPSLRSIQIPIKPGRTISKATVITREAQAAAWARGGRRSSGATFITDAHRQESVLKNWLEGIAKSSFITI